MKKQLASDKNQDGVGSEIFHRASGICQIWRPSFACKATNTDRRRRRFRSSERQPLDTGGYRPPGVGKSTLIGRLVSHWKDSGEKVAVLAVDPSSPRSGGALLADRMRMESTDSGDSVYFRSLATRGHPGGVSYLLSPMIDLLSLCGWSRIVIETVGSGQAETRVIAFADRVMMVDGPDRGDIIQAEKAGIIELADIIAINKSDKPGASRAAESILSLIHI